jgi:hypothetical protein
LENEPGAYLRKRHLNGGLPLILHDGVNRRSLDSNVLRVDFDGSHFSDFFNNIGQERTFAAVCNAPILLKNPF